MTLADEDAEYQGANDQALIRSLRQQIDRQRTEINRLKEMNGTLQLKVSQLEDKLNVKEAD